MKDIKPCGLDYCPYEELIGAYASCTACAWGKQNKEIKRSQENEKRKLDV